LIEAVEDLDVPHFDSTEWLAQHRDVLQTFEFHSDGPRRLPHVGVGRLFRFTAPTLARLSDDETLEASQAATVLTIPDRAQGAAIRGGGLWIARSDWSGGTLDRLDPETGTPQRCYEIAPGTEGIAFSSDGRLWAVSEAGSRHIYDHPFLGLFEPFFPLVFALDLSRLE
jgi:hypothetical protein